MKSELKITVKNRQYNRVKRDEVIKEGALHTLDGRNFNPLMNPESVGQTPSEFSRKRVFYNPVETKKEKYRREEMEKLSA
jgi:hypothetical protein